MKKTFLIPLALLIPITLMAASGAGRLAAVYFENTHTTTPSTPAAGRARVYVKSDNKIYILDSSGTETQVTSGGAASLSVSVETGNDTMSNSDDVLLMNCSAPCTLTLQAVGSATVKLYRIKNIGTHMVTVDANGSETFDRTAELTVELPPGGLPTSGIAIVPDTGGSSWATF